MKAYVNERALDTLLKRNPLCCAVNRGRQKMLIDTTFPAFVVLFSRETRLPRTKASLELRCKAYESTREWLDRMPEHSAEVVFVDSTRKYLGAKVLVCYTKTTDGEAVYHYFDKRHYNILRKLLPSAEVSVNPDDELSAAYFKDAKGNIAILLPIKMNKKG